MNNKGGRPPKSTTEKLKYRVTAKLATQDYYTLKSRARNAGISASEYLRECFRKGHVRQRLTAEHSETKRQVTVTDILRLNKVFNIHRDEKVIEWVRKQTDGYENELKTVTDSLMQEKLKLQVESKSY